MKWIPLAAAMFDVFAGAVFLDISRRRKRRGLKYCGFALIAVAAIMVLAALTDAPALAEPGYIIGLCASFAGLFFLM